MWDQALKEMSKIWRDKNPEFTGSFYDGSGLSPLNVCSASDMVNVLTVMHHSDEAKSFYESFVITSYSIHYTKLYEEYCTLHTAELIMKVHYYLCVKCKENVRFLMDLLRSYNFV